MVFWIPRFPLCQSWPVYVFSSRASLDLCLPLPLILTVLFFTLLIVLLFAVGLKGSGPFDTYLRVSHIFLPFFEGGLFAFEFYPEMLIGNVPSWCLQFFLALSDRASLFGSSAGPARSQQRSALLGLVLGQFPLRSLTLGPPVGVLAPGFGGRFGMGAVFRFLI